MTLNRTRSVLTALALTLLAAPAFAQPPATDGPNGWGHHGPDRARMEEFIKKHREEKIHDLHTILNIRPDQEAAFSAFQASMVPPPRGEHKPPPSEALTTPQRLDQMLARMDERTAEMRKHIEATKSFYAALSPEQQKVFDALGRIHGEHEGPHGGHGPDGGPMQGPGEAPPPPPGE